LHTSPAPSAPSLPTLTVINHPPFMARPTHHTHADPRVTDPSGFSSSTASNTVIKCVCICEYSLMWELTWMLRRVTYSRAWMVCFPLAARKVIVTSLPLLNPCEPVGNISNDEVVFGPCTVSTQVPPSDLSQILLKRRLAH
jgi:hypothetical protein